MDEPWIELLNSDWHDYLAGGRAEDRLDDPQWVRTFLAGWVLPDRIVSAKATRVALGDLRSMLRRFVDRAVAEESLTDEDLGALNIVLSAEPVVRRLEPSGSTYRMRLDPVRTSLRAVLAEIAKSFADMLIEGDLALEFAGEEVLLGCQFHLFFGVAGLNDVQHVGAYAVVELYVWC